MSNAASFTPAVLDRILAFLAALFLPSTAGNLEAARDAAGALLASYEVRTDRQLRLAALAIAFSFGALDSLSRAAEPDLPVNQVLRLRGNANALNRAAQQNEAKLDKSIGQPEAARPDEPRDLPPRRAVSGRSVPPAAPLRRASGGKAAPAATGGRPAGRTGRQAPRGKGSCPLGRGAGAAASAGSSVGFAGKLPNQPACNNAGQESLNS
jgi:hypothetical protein